MKQDKEEARKRVTMLDDTIASLCAEIDKVLFYLLFKNSFNYILSIFLLVVKLVLMGYMKIIVGCVNNIIYLGMHRTYLKINMSEIFYFKKGDKLGGALMNQYQIYPASSVCI